MAQINLALPRFKERAIKFSEARKILLKNMAEGVDLATCFIGPPGIGKTALVEEVAQEIKAHLCVIPLSCYDASELKGIPRVVSLDEMRKMHPSRVKENTSGYVTYYAHNFEFPATDDPDLWIFFFDEFNTVSPSTQVPIFQATQKRCITGSYQFPKNNRIVLAGNRPKDSEAVQPIPSPIISRVNLHEISSTTGSGSTGARTYTGAFALLSKQPGAALLLYRRNDQAGAALRDPPHLGLRQHCFARLFRNIAGRNEARIRHVEYIGVTTCAVPSVMTR